MYSFGIILFEIWCKFSTLTERAKVLYNLTKEHVVPSGWAEQNPVIDQLVSRLITSEKRPSAREILQGHTIPLITVKLTSEDISELLAAISYVDLQQSQAANNVLDSLFSETRKKQFLTDNEPSISQAEFEKSSLTKSNIFESFTEEVRLYGGSLFKTPILEQLTNSDSNGMRVMSHGGRLYTFRSSPWNYMIKEILKNDITSARFGQIIRTIKEGGKESLYLTYDIISPEIEIKSITELVECTQFFTDFIYNLSKEIKIKVVVSNYQTTVDFYRTQISIDEIQRICQIKNERPSIKLSDIPDIVKGKDIINDLIYAIKNMEIESCEFEMFSPYLFEYEGPSICILINNKQVARIGLMKEDFFNKLQTLDPVIKSYSPPSITSCLIDYQILSEVIINNKQKRTSILLIPYWEKIDGNPDIFKKERPIHTKKEWDGYIKNILQVSSSLKSEGYIVYIVKNNGQSIQELINSYSSKNIQNAILYHWDERYYQFTFFLEKPNQTLEKSLKSFSETSKVFC